MTHLTVALPNDVAVGVVAVVQAGTKQRDQGHGWVELHVLCQRTAFRGPEFGALLLGVAGNRAPCQFIVHSNGIRYEVNTVMPVLAEIDPPGALGSVLKFKRQTETVGDGLYHLTAQVLLLGFHEHQGIIPIAEEAEAR